MNGVNYAWDDNGNLLNDGVNAYAYDPTNRLSSVTSNQSAVTSFGYNGVGDRLRQTISGATTNYTLDLNPSAGSGQAAGLTQVLADGTNTYLYGVGRIGQYNNAMQYFGADGLGSVRQMYDASGAGVVQLNKRYDPFGNVVSTTGTAVSGSCARQRSFRVIFILATIRNPRMMRQKILLLYNSVKGNSCFSRMLLYRT